MNIILLGPPGAGKGTQAQRLVDERGMKAKAVMEAGELVSDEIVSGIIGDALDALAPETGIIFDGYPRTAAQAESLDEILDARGRSLHHVIELEVNEDALVDRITGRFTCGNCGEGYHDRYKLPAKDGVCDKCGSTEFKRRPDDNEATVRTRMAEYRAKTAPIHEARSIVSRVDGMASMNAVAGQIAGVLDA